MSDWFETRFRETADGGQPDPAFAARVRALVVEEWRGDAGSTPSVDTEPDDHEGDIIMLETEDRPPLGDAPTPSRRPPGRWLLAAAAVAVVAVIGAVLAAGGDDEDKIDTTPVAPNEQPARDIFSVPDFSSLEPGRYFIDPDGLDTTPLRVTYEIAAEGWDSWLGAVKDHAGGHAALSITVVTNVAQDACTDHAPLEPPLGPTVDDLATALTQLAPFTVAAPPTDVTLFGYPGKHLELTVPDLPVTFVRGEREFADCNGGNLHSWFSRNSAGAFFGYTGEAGESEEYWILDVEGTRLVIIKNSAPSSPPQIVAELDAIFDSIQIEP